MFDTSLTRSYIAWLLIERSVLYVEFTGKLGSIFYCLDNTFIVFIVSTLWGNSLGLTSCYFHSLYPLSGFPSFNASLHIIISLCMSTSSCSTFWSCPLLLGLSSSCCYPKVYVTTSSSSSSSSVLVASTWSTTRLSSLSYSQKSEFYSSSCWVGGCCWCGVLSWSLTSST
jgi:hypothetical protein